MLQGTYEDGSIDELSQMPEVEQHLFTYVDGKDFYDEKLVEVSLDYL